MNPKLYIYGICFIFLHCILTTHAMDNNAGNAGNEQQVPEMQFLQLPADSIANIGSSLDKNSSTALKLSCRRCYLTISTSNLFRALPPCIIERIIKNCSQNDLITLWRTSKYFYIRFIDHERPFRIRGDNFYPYFARQGTAIHQMIMHISKLIENAHHRTMSVSLDLAGQSLRPGLEKALFIPRLFAKLSLEKVNNSIVEINLSRNFTKYFPPCLVHEKVAQSTVQSNPATMNAINIACSFSPNLTKLILDANDLVAIPGQVARLAKLKLLSLAWNYLNTQSLGPCLQLTSLTELNLARNCLTTIIPLLPPNLRVLNLSGNPLDQETQRRLKEDRHGSKQLTIIFDKE